METSWRAKQVAVECFLYGSMAAFLEKPGREWMFTQDWPTQTGMVDVVMDLKTLAVHWRDALKIINSKDMNDFNSRTHGIYKPVPVSETGHAEQVRDPDVNGGVLPPDDGEERHDGRGQAQDAAWPGSEDADW